MGVFCTWTTLYRWGPGSGAADYVVGSSSICDELEDEVQQ